MVLATKQPPIVVDGVMYLTDSRGSVYAVDTADGHHMWTYDVTELLGGGRTRGIRFPTQRCDVRGWGCLQRSRFVYFCIGCQDGRTD